MRETNLARLVKVLLSSMRPSSRALSSNHWNYSESLSKAWQAWFGFPKSPVWLMSTLMSLKSKSGMSQAQIHSLPGSAKNFR